MDLGIAAMKRELISKLHAKFESLVHKETQTGTEFWLARDLQQVLGYGRWSNFARVIQRAMTVCELGGNDPDDHFLPVEKIEAGWLDHTKWRPLRRET